VQAALGSRGAALGRREGKRGQPEQECCKEAGDPPGQEPEPGHTEGLDQCSLAVEDELEQGVAAGRKQLRVAVAAGG